jgi:hypothetical protein
MLFLLSSVLQAFRPASFPASSIGIIQVFAEKAQNAEKLKKAVFRENRLCKNATVRILGPYEC